MGEMKQRLDQDAGVMDRLGREQEAIKVLANRFAREHTPYLPQRVSEHVFAMAWEHGHANGEGEVENYYMDFASLAITAFYEGKQRAAGDADA